MTMRLYSTWVPVVVERAGMLTSIWVHAFQTTIFTSLVDFLALSYKWGAFSLPQLILKKCEGQVLNNLSGKY